MHFRLLILTLCFGIIASPALLHAEESTGRILPVSRTTAEYEPFWSSEKNPFRRHVPPPAPPLTESWSKDWSLIGIYKSASGKVTVTLQHKVNGQCRQVGEDVMGSRMKIVEARLHRNRDSASVTLSLDGDAALFTYDAQPAGPALKAAATPPSISRRRALIAPPPTPVP